MKQLPLFQRGEVIALSQVRLRHATRRALAEYIVGQAPSFPLRALAEERARLALLRRARRRLARSQGRKGSKLRLVEFVISAAGARTERLLCRRMQSVAALERALCG
jgi:hypothetical protein